MLGAVPELRLFGICAPLQLARLIHPQRDQRTHGIAHRAEDQSAHGKRRQALRRFRERKRLLHGHNGLLAHKAARHYRRSSQEHHDEGQPLRRLGLAEFEEHRHGHRCDHKPHGTAERKGEHPRPNQGFASVNPPRVGSSSRRGAHARPQDELRRTRRR